MRLAKTITYLILLNLMVSCGNENLGGLGLDDSSDLKMSQPSAKATAQFGDISIIDSSALDYSTILSNSIKTPNNSALFISGSIECGLYTRTQVKSKGGKKQTSISTAAVKARILVNGVEAEPGEITFCERTQELSAVFQGLLTDEEGNVCLQTNLETGVITIDEECMQEEEIDLILSTMTATSFNFVAEVGQGIQNVEFQAKIITSTSTTGDGEATALATIGKGAVLIETVRLRKNDPIAKGG